MQMLSPTLNYSLTTRSHRRKAACKRSMAQPQQGLPSTRCEMKKTASPQPKNGGKIATLGPAFLREEWKSADKNWEAQRTPPTHGHPKRGWPSVKMLGSLAAPNFEGKRFPSFRTKTRNFPEKKKDIPQEIERNRFSNRFPLRLVACKEEKKKKEGKESG